MKTLAIAGLCAGLATAPLVAKAAELVLFDPAGHPVAVLVPVAQPSAPALNPFTAQQMMAQQIGFPVAGLFAQQDALIQRMMSDMRSLQTATMPAGGGIDAGSTVMVSSFSDGTHSCSRTTAYRPQAGSAPLVTVSQTGDGCAALPQPSPRALVPAALEPQPLAPSVAVPSGPKLYQIDYRHPAQATAAHRG